MDERASGGREAATDLFTNYMRLGLLTHGSDPRPWLGLSPAPMGDMPVFLHELTHHWTFLTPVNFAIAALTARARISAVRYMFGDEVTSDPLVDIAAARSAMHLLRPINEGLALFAEFDATTRRRSRVQSLVLDGMLACFSPPSDWDFPDSFPEGLRSTYVAAGSTRRLRLSSAALEKKASLLLRPLDPSLDPYLLGYLSVKSLWRTGCRSVPVFASETDLFLMYLRSFLFEDASLVGALLEPADTPAVAADRVVRALSRRVTSFDEVTPSDVEEFQAYVAADPVSTPNVLAETPGLRLSERSLARARELLDDQVAFMLNVQKGEAQEALAFSRWAADALNQRHIATLVSADCEIIIKGSDNSWAIRFADEEILHGGADSVLTTAPPTPGSASIDVVLLTVNFARAVVISRTSIPLICQPMWVPREDSRIRDDISKWYRGRSLLGEVEARARRIDEWLLQAASPAEPAVRHVRESVLPLWLDVAFRYARSYEDIDRCAELVKSAGLRPIMQTSKRLRQLALMGLALSVDVSETGLRREFESHGWDLTQVLNDFDDLYASNGFPPPPQVAAGTVYASI